MLVSISVICAVIRGKKILFCLRLSHCGNMQKRTFVTIEQHTVFHCFAHFRSVWLLEECQCIRSYIEKCIDPIL